MGFQSEDDASSSNNNNTKRRSSVAAATSMFNKLAADDSNSSIGYSPKFTPNSSAKSKLYGSVSDMPFLDIDEDDDKDKKGGGGGGGRRTATSVSPRRVPHKHTSLPPRNFAKGTSILSPTSVTSSGDKIPPWKRKLLEQKGKGRSYSVRGDPRTTSSSPSSSSGNAAQKTQFLGGGGRRPSFLPQSSGGSDDELSLDDVDYEEEEKKSTEDLEDVKIQAKINPSIQEKLQLRRYQRSGPPAVPTKTVSLYRNNNNNRDGDEFVPEHIRRFRAREAKLQAEHAEKEAARKAALDEKARIAEQVVFARVLGWYHRNRYPKLKAAHAQKMRERAEQERIEALRHASATRIQAMARRYHPRKHFKRHWAGMVKRLRTKQRIKQIQMQVELIERQTKTELIEMEKEYKDQNSAYQKALRKKVKTELKAHEEKMKEIKKDGHSEIEYIKAENRRLREEMIVIHKDTQLLQKQSSVLELKGKKESEKFKSLQKWCEKKIDSNNKKKISESKCRNRYLPKYRRDLAERNQKCIVESRVKDMNKKCIYKIVDLLQSQSTDPDVTSDVVAMILETEQTLEEELGDYEVPEELQKWLGW